MIHVACHCYKRLALTRTSLPTAIANAGAPANWRLVDDGSGDGTAAFLHSLAGLNVEVVSLAKNSGMSANRNASMNAAKAAGAEVWVQIDNDVWLPPNWLRDLVKSPFDITSAWIVNDQTLMRHVCQGKPMSELPSTGFVNTGACGGACIAYGPKVLASGIQWHEGVPCYGYEDARFNAACVGQGMTVGVNLGVQVWHLEDSFCDDVEYAKAKLLARHKVVTGSELGFDASWQRWIGKRLVVQ